MPDAHAHGRRTFLRSAAAIGATCSLGGAAGCLGVLEDDELTVAVYGGIFKDVLDESLFEPLNEEVDFEAVSQEQPTAEEAMTQYETAVDAGEAPVDVAIMSTVGVLRGINGGVWHVWEDAGAFENLEYISEDLVRETDGGVASIGALSWFINLVQNTEVIEEPLDTWEVLWDDAYENQLGLLGLASNSFLLDITAVTHFGGQDILADRDGVLEVFETLEGVRPQANFWYESEAEFQQRLRDAEVPAGMLYSDITTVMQEEGHPVRSNFPAEGSVLDSGSWVTLESTELIDEARTFIDYASRPDVQDRVARNLFTSPTISRAHSQLDDEMYERIAGPGPDEAIVPRYELYLEEEDWVNERWEEFIIG